MSALLRLPRLGLRSLGLGMALSADARGMFYADFAANVYQKDQQTAALTDVFALTRASTKWADNVAGTWAEFAINVAARTDKGVALGSADVTNYALGADFAGAVAGTPGTMPTKMPMSALPGGLTRTISLGTINGLPSLRVAISGTPASTTASFIDIVGNADGPSVSGVGDRAEAGVLMALASGTQPTIALNINERNVSNTNQGAGANSAVTGLDATLRYKSNARVVTNATSTKTTSSLSISFTSGVAVDFALDIVAPSHVKGSPPTPIPIITTGTAKTQSADAASLLLPATPIDFMLTFTNGAYRAAFNKSGTYALGANDLLGGALKKAQDLRRRAPPIYDNFAVQADGDLPGRFAKSGQVWQNLIGSSGSGVNGVIASGSLTSKVDSSPPSTVCYNAIVHNQPVTSVYSEVGFEVGADDTDGAPLAALISCPQRGAEPAVVDIVKGSVHVLFYRSKCFVQYFDPALWDGTTNPNGTSQTVLSHTYPVATTAGVKKLVGWRLVGNTLYVLMPDGTEQAVTNANWAPNVGNIAIWEHGFQNVDGGGATKFGNVYAGDDAFLAEA